VRTSAAGGSYVVKSDASIMQEIFAGYLALTLGIRIPRMRILNSSDMEWVLLQISIDTFSRSTSNKDTVLSAPGSSCVTLLMEFIPAITNLSGASITNASKSLHSLGQPWCSPLDQGQNLRHIGRIIAFDLLINNSDRVPVASVWDNGGNIGNLLFREMTETNEVDSDNASPNGSISVVAIDQVLMPIHTSIADVGATSTCKGASNSNPMLTRYIQRVDKFLEKVCGSIKGNQSADREIKGSC
jgi:hypothetical protein